VIDEVGGGGIEKKMAINNIQGLIKQLDNILGSFNQARAKSHQPDLSDISKSEILKLTTQARAAIMRVVHSDSPYAQQVTDILSRQTYDSLKLILLTGVISALKCDLEAGYMQTEEERIHGELFSDFLEMASYLLEEGFKDPAAVVCGSSLESHLRQLAKKFKIETTMKTSSDDLKLKKTATLNDEIYKANGYSATDQKSVTAWLDLRNKAAHGLYDKYEIGQVRLMIDGVCDFIRRNPA
jgi:hypothetical protein